MRPKRLSLSLEAADRDGVCAAQTLGGAGALTIDGLLAAGGVATMDVPRHISLYSAADLSAVTFTITGTDRFGYAVSEAMAGPTAGATVASAANFSTITDVSASAAVGTAVEVGSADSADTAWVPVDRNKAPFDVSIGTVLAPSTSALTFGLDVTYDDVQAEGFQENDATAIAHGTITGKSANFIGAQSSPVMAVRLAVTGHTSGGVTATITQAG